MNNNSLIYYPAKSIFIIACGKTYPSKIGTDAVNPSPLSMTNPVYLPEE